MGYYVDDRYFDSLDDARAYIISVMERTKRISDVEVYRAGAHTLSPVGFVSRGKIPHCYIWHANGVWVLKKNGKTDKRLV